MQWITVKTTSQLSFALDARIVGAFPVNVPELGRPSKPSADLRADPAESRQTLTPKVGVERAIFTAGNLLTAPAHYFPRDEVDVPAEPTSIPTLLFPERAFISNLSGKVRARLYINESGTVDELEIIETTPQHQPFIDSATTALKETIFIPAMIAGHKVKSQRMVEVIFNAEEDSPLPEQSHQSRN